MMKKQHKSLFPKTKVGFVEKMTLFLAKSLITKTKVDIETMMSKSLIPKTKLTQFPYGKPTPPKNPPARFALPEGRARCAAQGPLTTTPSLV